MSPGAGSSTRSAPSSTASSPPRSSRRSAPGSTASATGLPGSTRSTPCAPSSTASPRATSSARCASGSTGSPPRQSSTPSATASTASRPAGPTREQLERLGSDAEALRAQVAALEVAARRGPRGGRRRARAGRDAAEAAEARSASEAAARIAEVDRGAGSVLAEVKATRDRLEEVAGLARAAHEAAGDGRAEQDELRAGLARLGGEVQVAREQLEQAAEEALGARTQAATAGEAAVAAREDAGRAREDAQALRRELGAGRERLETVTADLARLGRTTDERLTGVDTTFNLLRADLGANREQMDALRGGVDRLADQVAKGRAESEARSAELLDELAKVREVAERADAGVAELREELAAVRTQAELATAVAEKANAAAEKAGTVAETRQARRRAGRGAAGRGPVRALDDGRDEGGPDLGRPGRARRAPRGREGARRPPTPPATAPASTSRRCSGRSSDWPRRAARGALQQAEDEPPPEPREPRHGFDDESQPMAVIGVDGKFKELNPSFCRLVGYQEHEFAKAAWPSPHDRQYYAQQQEQFSELVSGELESVHVASTYMHGQGLMVPVIGEITAVKGEDGITSHLLLRAEERERAG